jgi:hypothetical protein
VEAPESGVRGVQQTPPFRALIDIFRSCVWELHDVATQHAISDEAAALRPAPGSGEAAARKHRSISPPGALRRAPKAVRRGASSVFKRSKPPLAATMRLYEMVQDYVATRWYRAPEVCRSFFSMVINFILVFVHLCYYL